MNYQLKYDLGNYNSSAVSFIESVYNNSLKLLNDVMINDDNYSSYKDIIIKSIGYLEDYLFYMYSFNNEVFFQIFNNLMNNLKVISILPADKSYKYGDCDLQNGIIYINPLLESSNGLDYNSRIRLNLYHNLGHIINSSWMNDAKNEILNKIHNNESYKISVHYGLRYLDEAISQNNAENITYYFIGKERPKRKPQHSKILGTYLTNFDYYKELHQHIIDLAMFVVDLGRSMHSDEALDIMCNMALKHDFIKNIFLKLQSQEYREYLVVLLYYLGVILQDYYTCYGYQNEINTTTIYINEAIRGIYDIELLLHSKSIENRNSQIEKTEDSDIIHNNTNYEPVSTGFGYGYPPINMDMEPITIESSQTNGNIISIDSYLKKKFEKKYR